MYGWIYLIIFKIVRLFYKILFLDCDLRFVMFMYLNMDWVLVKWFLGV